MELEKILEILFRLVIMPAIPLLVVYIKKLIECKINELQVKSDNELVDKYLQIAEDGILKAVTYVSQTYVESLKKENKFGLNEQKTAFDMAKNTFEDIVTDEVKSFISEAVEDYDKWVLASIESMVKKIK